MLLDIDRDRNIDFLGKKMSIVCRTHIAVGHRVHGGSPGPLRLKYAIDYKSVRPSISPSAGSLDGLSCFRALRFSLLGATNAVFTASFSYIHNS